MVDRLLQFYHPDVFDKLSRGKVHYFAISGKIGSGKDTIAPLLINALGINDRFVVHTSFADSLKQELQEIINIINMNNNFILSVNDISQVMNVDYDISEKIVGFLYDDVKNGRVKDSFTVNKTQSLRYALQYWGTDVRKKGESSYWINKTIPYIMRNILNDRSVYLTDVRFVDEAEAIRQSGGTTIRLNISPEEQSRRIMLRDGIPMNNNTRDHSSETSLDNYSLFDITINTDNKTPQKIVEEIIEKYNRN